MKIRTNEQQELLTKLLNSCEKVEHKIKNGDQKAQLAIEEIIELSKEVLEHFIENCYE